MYVWYGMVFPFNPDTFTEDDTLLTKNDTQNEQHNTPENTKINRKI